MCIYIHLLKQEQEEQQRGYRLRLSYLEIYREECRDLLANTSSPSTPSLSIREDAGGITIAGLSLHEVTSLKAVAELLHRGALVRRTAATGMNATRLVLWLCCVGRGGLDGGLCGGWIDAIDVARCLPSIKRVRMVRHFHTYFCHHPTPYLPTTVSSSYHHQQLPIPRRLHPLPRELAGSGARGGPPGDAQQVQPGGFGGCVNLFI